MKIELNVINFNTPVDKYSYSLEGFYYNDKEIKHENKLRKISQLIALTSEWEETIDNFVDNGFVINVEMGEFYKKFAFSNSKVPKNFMNFVYEMKSVTLED